MREDLACGDLAREVVGAEGREVVVWEGRIQG